MPTPSRLSREFEPFATIGTWPRQNRRGQVHFRLSRQIMRSSAITLAIGGKRFRLSGGGGDAWAQDRAMTEAETIGLRSERLKEFANAYVNR